MLTYADVCYIYTHIRVGRRRQRQQRRIELLLRMLYIRTSVTYAIHTHIRVGRRRQRRIELLLRMLYIRTSVTYAMLYILTTVSAAGGSVSSAA
jgi:hypothetical protein